MDKRTIIVRMIERREVQIDRILTVWTHKQANKQTNGQKFSCSNTQKSKYGIFLIPYFELKLILLQAPLHKDSCFIHAPINFITYGMTQGFQRCT